MVRREWTPQRDRKALSLAAREKNAVKKLRRRQRNKALSWLAAAGLCFAVGSGGLGQLQQQLSGMGAAEGLEDQALHLPLSMIADLLDVSPASVSAVVNALGAISAINGGRKLLAVLSRNSKSSKSKKSSEEELATQTGALTDRQRQLLGLPPKGSLSKEDKGGSLLSASKLEGGGGSSTPLFGSPTTPKKTPPRLSSTIHLADTPVRYDASIIADHSKGKARSRDGTPNLYERRAQSPSLLEGDGRISTPEQLDVYLKQLQTTLDSDLKSMSSPTGPYASPHQTLSDAAFGFSLSSNTVPTLPQYRASPSPISVVKSPAEKTLASSWDYVGQFLERNKLSISLLEQTEDNLRQWFSSTVLHSLVEAIGSAHREVERAAAQPGAACPLNVTPPPVKVLPLAMCPSIACEDFKKVKDKDMYLDKYQLEKWLEVLSASPSTAAAAATTTTTPSIGSGGLGLGLGFGSSSSFFSSPSLQQPANQYDQGKRQQLVQAIQDWLGILLLLEGKCPGAKELLSPNTFPKGYLNSRIHQISRGRCVNDFIWNSGKSHLQNKKWNKNDFPTDSSILCYLFCVYLRHPNWRFERDFKLSTPRTSFFVGSLPHKPGDYFRAILPQMSTPKATGQVILFQSRFENPLYTLAVDGEEEELRVTGHSGLFRGLALFLMLLRRRDHDWIGQNRLQNLGLSKVVCTEN